MRVEFLGVPMDDLTLEETVAQAALAMRERRRCQHVALNVAKLVKMRSNPDLRRDVVESDIIGIDGMGIVWGARLLGLSIPERVAGIDLLEQLLHLCARDGFRPFFLGATKDTLEKAISVLRAKLPTLQIAGWHHGYFEMKKDQEIVQAIRESHADCLFIGLPTPRKEHLLANFRDSFGVSFIMGVGGSFDVIAGAVNRSPLWMQNIGLEWLYRTYQEPRRMIWRYFSTNTIFAALLAKAMIGRMAK